jgi:hypothetical protein
MGCDFMIETLLILILVIITFCMGVIIGYLFRGIETLEKAEVPKFMPLNARERQESDTEEQRKQEVMHKQIENWLKYDGKKQGEIDGL